LFNGIDAHAAVVGVGAAGFQAGFEDVHLEAGEGGTPLTQMSQSFRRVRRAARSVTSN
jgi:hypothetical protein